MTTPAAATATRLLVDLLEVAVHFGADVYCGSVYPDPGSSALSAHVELQFSGVLPELALDVLRGLDVDVYGLPDVTLEVDWRQNTGYRSWHFPVLLVAGLRVHFYGTMHS